jgi:hypothetical protein
MYTFMCEDYIDYENAQALKISEQLCFIRRMDFFEQKLKLMMNHTTCGP